METSAESPPETSPGEVAQGALPPNGVCFDPDSPGDLKRFRASDAYEFAYRQFVPVSQAPRGYVVALHGIQSHSGWYGYSSRLIAEAGFDVRFLDRRGSGLNEFDRGHAPHAERLINDVVQFLSMVRDERDRTTPGAPVVLLSVSWGGKLAAAVAACRAELVDAMALLYPGICPRIRPSAWQRVQLRLARSLDITRKVAPIPLRDPALFTAEPVWQRRIESDRLALHEATSGFFLSNAELDRLVADSAAAIRCPVLCMLAGRDRIIDNVATRSFLEQVSSRDKTVLEYENAAHTLEFEPNRDAIVADLIEWLNRRCESPVETV